MILGLEFNLPTVAVLLIVVAWAAWAVRRLWSRGALVSCDAAACARCPAAGEVRMRSIRMGLGAKSTGNGKSVRTRVKRKRSARVSSRIKSAK